MSKCGFVKEDDGDAFKPAFCSWKGPEIPGLVDRFEGGSIHVEFNVLSGTWLVPVYILEDANGFIVLSSPPFCIPTSFARDTECWPLLGLNPWLWIRFRVPKS